MLQFLCPLQMRRMLEYRFYREDYQSQQGKKSTHYSKHPEFRQRVD
jgi:hypothetical protein